MGKGKPNVLGRIETRFGWLEGARDNI